MIQLTHQQLYILISLCMDIPPKIIAQNLGISRRTMDCYINLLKSKFNRSTIYGLCSRFTFLYLKGDIYEKKKN